ncbi:MAG: PKD domain-containing protein [Bacteroidota bacterium]
MKVLSTLFVAFFVAMGALQAQNCDAQFQYFVQASGTVTFYDSSFVTPGFSANYYWSFGDGLGDTVQNPVHTYNAPGTYIACLIVTTTNGSCSDSICQTITIGGTPPNCNADFSITHLQGGTFQFNNSSSPGGGISQWTFGDGSSSSSTNPVHSYMTNGTYTVCLIYDSSTPLLGCADTVCLSLTVTGIGNPGCLASFVAIPDTTVSSTGYIFDAAGSTGGNNLQYSWDFGDNTFGNGQLANHMYNAPGTYTVCLTISDSSAGCFDTYCSSIVVSGGGNPNCHATFQAYPDSTMANGFIFDANGSTGSNNLQYSWDFGDQSFGTGVVTSHSYNTTGPYIVCLTISDSAAGCFDTFCDSVGSGGGNPANCNADFIYNINNGVVNFSNLSSGMGATYAWDFGDGNSSSMTNPSHSYNAPGVYGVCLTITVATGGLVCTDIHCDTITIASNPNGLTISGSVFPFDTTNLIYNGVAYLIQHDSTAGTLNLIDTVDIQQSYYTFTGVSAGSYLIKAALRPASPYYATNLPTYLGDELFWSNATSVVATAFNISNPPILLIQGTNPGGPGFIGGLVSQGANKTGDPISGISVLLLDATDQPIAHTETDVDGKYSFPSLAYGDYKIYLEIAGKLGDPLLVTLSAANPSVETVDVFVDDDSWSSQTTSIEDLQIGSVLSLYPNPTASHLQIHMELKALGELELSVLNLVGSTVLRQQESHGIGTQTFQMNVSDLARGSYILRVKSGDQQSFHRFVKGE